MNASRLLINEQPLQLLPSLAVKIGVNEAIVLQQIHFWLKINEQGNRNFRQNAWWTYATHAQWLKQFPFFSDKTLRRTLSSLIESGVLLARHLADDPRDRTLWYTIDYDALNRSDTAPGSDDEPDDSGNGTRKSPCGQNDHMQVAGNKRASASGQSDHMASGQNDHIQSVNPTKSDMVKMTSCLIRTESLTESPTENHIESTTTKTNAQAQPESLVVVDADYVNENSHPRNDTQHSETCVGMTAISDVIAPTKRDRLAGTPKILSDAPGPPPADVAEKLAAAGVQVGLDTPAMAALRAAGVIGTKRLNLADAVMRHGEQRVLDLCAAVSKGYVNVADRAAYLAQTLAGDAPCPVPQRYYDDRAQADADAQTAARNRIVREQQRVAAVAEAAYQASLEARWDGLPQAERAAIEDTERAAQMARATNEMARRVAVGPIGQNDLRRACIARMTTYKSNAAPPMLRAA